MKRIWFKAAGVWLALICATGSHSDALTKTAAIISQAVGS
jgi:hypothetical protein